ncbi:DUF2339 domain-containing protein [Aquibium carbonis]|uniref:DUF2339 domain-containing protein n=1 Tax=Aquibium carbonis TaxID=2495581 RepID=A0A3S0G3E2_9HYPH|nr:DUF2339 domain-containing protein [Aquibium carbonis]RST82824.1 DUF2339 domain-containing protein [Aquibium carbonis]
MIEFIVAALIVALAVVAMRLNDRLNRLQREFEALRGFVLDTMPVPAGAAQGAAAAGLSSVPADDAASDAEAAAPPVDPALAERESTTRALAELEALAARPGNYAWSPESQAAREPEPEPEVEPARASKRPDIETALGTRWAVWVGGLALALGGVFLVRYSIEAGIFGPGLRLTMAALFGMALLAGGEAIRRNGLRMPVEGIDGAWMPGILTAVGVFTLFGTVYAAHGLYGFIGPTLAFLLLGLLGIGAILAALIHGQALAGVGLLGAFATPLLVSSQAPSPWVLFGYLAIVLVAAAAIARLRGWTGLMTGAVVGMGLWSLLYLVTMMDIRLAPALLANAALLAAVALVWLADRDETARVDPPSVAAAVVVGLAALLQFNDPDIILAGGEGHAALLVAAMAAIAWWRPAALPLLLAAGGVVVLAHLRIALSGFFAFEILGEPVTFQGPAVLPWTSLGAWMSALLALLFLGLGFVAARGFLAGNPRRAVVWSAFAVIVPLAVLTGGWIAHGDVDRDLLRAAAALALMLAFAAAGEALARSEEPPLTGGLAVSIAFVGAALAAAVLLLMAFGPLWTTMLAAAAAGLPALATRWRSYPVLGWLSVGAAVFVLLRAAIDPTIVGAEFLGQTPVFNALLPGYGIPALAFVFAAWQLARTTNGRPRLAMEAAAVLFALLTAAMLVRHAMSGGIVDGAAVTLAEQSIYTLIMLGAGAILVALDARSPSAVMRIGSLAAAVLSVVLIAIRHFGTLNPLSTGEPTGRLPFLDLLLIGYLVPAAGAAGLAWFARDRRPPWYSIMLALTAAALAFAWLSLTVRRLFQGENLAFWQGMSQLETYAYSAVWLALGVGILVLGVRFASQALRVASGFVVALAVAKVFLFDMAELEGVLRAFSFIGLGAVLIGIGLFYQRLLTSAAAKQNAGPEPESPPTEEAPSAEEPPRRVTMPPRETPPADEAPPAAPAAEKPAPAEEVAPVETLPAEVEPSPDEKPAIADNPAAAEAPPAREPSRPDDADEQARRTNAKPGTPPSSPPEPD